MEKQTFTYEQLVDLFAKTNDQFKQTRIEFKDTKAQFKETDVKINTLPALFEGEWGRLMESLVEDDLINLLKGQGIEINDTSTRRKGSKDGERYEFDIVATNSNEIVIVEVKTTLRVRHVQDFMRKLNNAKRYMSEYHQHAIYAAIACLRCEESSEVYAEKKGLLVIRATGDSAAIINCENFQPKVW